MAEQLVQPEEIILDWGQPEPIQEDFKACLCRLECPLEVSCETISDYLISMSDVEKMWFEHRCQDAARTSLEDFEKGYFYNATAFKHWLRWGQQLEVAVRRFLTPRPWAWRVGTGDHDCIIRSLQKCRCQTESLNRELELDLQSSLLHRGEIEMLHEDHKNIWAGEDIGSLMHDPATKTDNYQYRRWLFNVSQVPDGDIGQFADPFESLQAIKRKSRKSPSLGVVFYRRRSDVLLVRRLQGHFLIQSNEGLTPPLRFEFHLPLEREVLFALSAFARALISYSCRVGRSPREISRLFYYGEWDVGEPPQTSVFSSTESGFVFPPRDSYAQKAFVFRFLVLLDRHMKEGTEALWPRIKSKCYETGFTRSRLFFRGQPGKVLDGFYAEAEGNEREVAVLIGTQISSFFKDGAYQERQRIISMRRRQEDHYVDMSLLKMISENPNTITQLALSLDLSKSQVVQSLSRQPWLRLRDGKWDLAEPKGLVLEEGLLTCAVCLNDKAVVASRVCGHLCLCKECSLQLDVCPICRVSYRSEQLIRIYY